jgi:CBS domain-containing protein
MQVRDILARKGRQVCAINHLQPLRDAITIMHRARIGAVVVVNAASGAAMGTLSQDEVLAGMAELGASALPHCATGPRRRPPPLVSEAETTDEAMKLMTRQRARHLLVVDDEGAPVGIILMGDLVAARIGAAELEASVLRDIARSRLLAG